MAKQPKKKTRVRKKTRVQKKPVQKRRAKKTLKRSNLKKNIFIVLGVVLLISMVAFGYFLGQYHTNSKHDTMLKSDKDIKPDKINPLFDDLSAIKVKSSEIKKEPSLKKNIDSQKDTKKVKITQKQEVKKSEIIALADRSEKPKLVIIIDDVFKKSQLRDIQALKMKITPSIFPPFALSMKSHTLARGLKHYMIHLPMESGKKKFNAQFKTLKTSFSKTQIEERVKELRKLFPTARYVNNHTGSVFTNDYQAMYTLYAALRKEGFVFVDSRTIGSTKVRKIAHAFGDAYVRRDIFIDNKQSEYYIHQQLKRAVKKAKRQGYAIAIGHPHAVTMRALKSAKNIFKEVELVYIDEIYK